MRHVYLDNNATTPLHPEVKARLIEAMDSYGNPSSMHEYGRISRQKIETARNNVAEFIGAKADEIIFVGSGSEANNTVLSTFSCRSKSSCCFNNRTELITTKIEHPCVLEASKCMTNGIVVKYLDVDSYGRINLDQLAEMISEKTGLVSVMMANNEIGTVQDIKAVSQIAKKYGALVHTDAVQAVGKIPVNVDDLGVDFLTLSAHKIYGPKGIGALYIRSNTPFCPLIHGGHQEYGRRAGTENTLGIIGLGEAVKWRKAEMTAEAKQLNEFKSYMYSRINEAIPDVKFNGHPEHSLPGTLNVSFAGCEGEAILLYLDLEGIMVSTGSACASGSLDPSHVIMATGLGVEYAHGSIRISMGRETTKADIDYMLEHLIEIIAKIRKMSTAYTAR